MTIRVVYEAEPNFPATQQHPQAVRAKIGGYWVDYVGSAPSAQEVADHMSPPPSAEQVRDASFKADPARVDWVDRLRNASPQQIETYITNNVTNLAQARTVLIALAKVLAVVVKE